VRAWLILGVVLLAAVVAAPAYAATAPPGYHVVYKAFTAPQSGFATMGSAPCPTGTVTWGGGVSPFAWEVPMTLVSSYWNGAMPGSWVVDVGNGEPFTDSVDAAAICADKPKGYKLAIASGDAPIAQLTGTNVICPRGKLLSGGFASTSDTIVGNIAAARPIPGSQAFQGFEANQHSDTDIPYHVYAICGAKPPGYARRSASTTVAAGQQVSLGAACPTGTSVIGGGIGVSPLANGALPEESIPDSGGAAWYVMLDNTTTQAETLTAYAICAA